MYVNSTTERNGVTREVRARFPPEQWNAHQQTVNDAARTNNYTEAWNRRFESLVANGHPSVWTTIDMLHADDAEASAMLLKYAAGSLPKKRCRRAVARTQRRLHQLCMEYAASSWSVDLFRKVVSNNIHKQR